MRPEKARAMLREAFETFLATKDTAALYAALPAARKLADKCKNDGNPITGPELFTQPDHQAVLNKLEYISDRFYAQHRLTWLIYVLENNLA